MAHNNQRNFIRIIAGMMPMYFRRVNVLEVGSLDINGSVRDFFDGCSYVGLDVAAGKGVDVVCEGQRYDAPDGAFDHVISCEVMEHNPFWRETVRNMIRMCRPGGLLTLTCASVGRRPHGTSACTPQDSPLTIEKGWNYYRNLTRRNLVVGGEIRRHFDWYGVWYNWRSFDLCFVGIKKGGPNRMDSLERWRCLTQDINRYMISENKGAKSRLCDMLSWMRCERFLDFARYLKRTNLP